MDNPSPPDRNLPPTKDAIAVGLEKNGFVSYALQEYERAFDFYTKDLEMRKEVQSQESRGIHKGGPLHMMGMISLLRGEANLATRYFLLAYTEDTLLTGIEEEDEADLSPAAKILRDLFKLRQKILREIKIASQGRKRLTWQSQTDPEPILHEALTRLNFDISNLKQYWQQQVALREKTELGFPQPLELRVFVGAKYGEGDPEIQRIKRIVVTLGYVPVLAREVETPRERTHEHASILLHTCRYPYSK